MGLAHALDEILEAPEESAEAAAQGAGMAFGDPPPTGELARATREHREEGEAATHRAGEERAREHQLLEREQALERVDGAGEAVALASKPIRRKVLSA